MNLNLYIHQSSCISPQQTFEEVNLRELKLSENSTLKALEPDYHQIPRSTLRRMGKAVRMAVGAALPLLAEQPAPDGIIIGTGNGGREDFVRFLNQIIDYEEGNLTPTNFVQSTSNAIAAQIGLLAVCTGYNNTHVHRGHSFENALLDAAMQLAESPSANLMVGGVDEFSEYNYNIEHLAGWYKKEAISNLQLYQSQTPGSLAGESAALFKISASNQGASSCISHISIFPANDPAEVELMLKKLLPTGTPDLLLSGENGDARFKAFYDRVEAALGQDLSIARFKHVSGEHPTAVAMAVWLADQVLKGMELPDHMIKNQSSQQDTVQKILIYNNFIGEQHSFILMEKID